MQESEYPSGFRFISEMEKFKKCVDIAKIMLERSQLTLLFGCIKDIKIEILVDKEQFSNDYTELEFEEFKEILLDEVAIIMEQNMKTTGLEEPQLESYLRDKNVSEETAICIISEKKKKRKYVQDILMNGELSTRYLLKEKTLNDKLCNIDYELNKFIFDDGSDIRYSVIELSTSDHLGSERIPDFMIKRDQANKLKFVCDRQDLDYIIKRLEYIRERL